MPTNTMIINRESTTESTREVFPALINLVGTPTMSIDEDLLAKRRGAEPEVVRQARECIERALTGGTDYPGSSIKREPEWRFKESSRGILLGAAYEESTSRLHGWGLQPSAPGQLHVEIVRLIREMTGMSQERVARMLGVTRQALNLWDRRKPISHDNRRRLLGVLDVLERASIHYRTPETLTAWLDTPMGAEAATPAELIERGEIGRARTLAISTPAPTLLRLGFWKERPVPTAVRAGSERRPGPVMPNRDEEFLDFTEDSGEDVETLMDE